MLGSDAIDTTLRKQSRSARRTQLIEATIEVMAQRGYARITLTEVANRAGVSHGLVNFHFKSKELLLAETLNYLYEEYLQNWTTALERAGPSAQEQLDALIKADFRPEICTPARLATWCSFWGEATSRPLYQEKCGQSDDNYILRMEEICARLLSDHGYSGRADRIARVIRLTIEGTWMDMMTQSTPYSRQEALQTVYCAAAAFFPHHFGEGGLSWPI